MIGGGGEKRTLKLVAQYADACNVSGGVDVVRHKIEVLRGHCDDRRARSVRGLGDVDGSGAGHAVGRADGRDQGDDASRR